jgi:predicted nucleotidyltransferase
LKLRKELFKDTSTIVEDYLEYSKIINKVAKLIFKDDFIKVVVFGSTVVGNYTGVFAVILSAIALGLVYSNTNFKLVRSIRILSIVIAVLVWLTLLFVAPVYTQEYPIDRNMILKYPDTAVAHEFGGERTYLLHRADIGFIVTNLSLYIRF